MLGFVSQWGHAVTAILFAAIAVWLLKDLSKGRGVWPLVLASAMTSAWALLSASQNSPSLVVPSPEETKTTSSPYSRYVAWTGVLPSLPTRRSPLTPVTSSHMYSRPSIGVVVWSKPFLTTLPTHFSGPPPASWMAAARQPCCRINSKIPDIPILHPSGAMDPQRDGSDDRVPRPLRPGRRPDNGQLCDELVVGYWPWAGAGWAGRPKRGAAVVT